MCSSFWQRLEVRRIKKEGTPVDGKEQEGGEGGLMGGWLVDNTEDNTEEAPIKQLSLILQWQSILVNKELAYMKALGKLCAGIWCNL